MNLGNNIARFRKEEKISQEELAELLGVSRQTISNWELGETSPTAKEILTLTQIFKKSADELLGLDTNNIVMEKINKTEKLIKKQVKITKIIFITIYVLIMLLLVSYIIYVFSRKDYTRSYQGDFYCEINDDTYKGMKVSLKPGGGREYNWDTHEYVYHDNIYKVEITEYKQNGDEDSYLLSVGYSYKEAIDSLNYIKRTFIDNGAKCR